MLILITYSLKHANKHFKALYYSYGKTYTAHNVQTFIKGANRLGGKRNHSGRKGKRVKRLGRTGKWAKRPGQCRPRSDATERVGLCPCLRSSVNPSFGLFVRPSVCLSVFALAYRTYKRSRQTGNCSVCYEMD